MSTACGRLRPPRCSSSRTSSKLAESEASGVQIGNIRRRSPGIRSLRSSASRAAIQLRLPRMVLISPLWAMIPVRVRQRPGRERVGGEPGVHQRDGADAPARRTGPGRSCHLVGGKHSLVDDGPAGQRREVHADAALAGLPLGLLARHSMTRSSSSPVAAAPAEPARLPPGRSRGDAAPSGRPAGCAGLRPARCRPARPGRRARRASRAPRRPPTTAYFSITGIARRPRPAPSGRNTRPGRVGAGRRQVEVHHGAVELVGDLDHDAGAVTGVRARRRGPRGGPAGAGPPGPWRPPRGSAAQRRRPRTPPRRRRARELGS